MNMNTNTNMNVNASTSMTPYNLLLLEYEISFADHLIREKLHSKKETVKFIFVLVREANEIGRLSSW